MDFDHYVKAARNNIPLVVVGVLILVYLCKKLFRKRLRPLLYAGKVVVVTGASSGIGEKLAWLYAELGADVALAARRADRLREVVTRCRELQAKISKGGSHRPGEILPVQVDLSTETGCRTLISTVIEKLGKIDILICNAGKGSIFPAFETVNLAEHRAMMEINYWSAVVLTQAALPHLRKTHGSICAVSSLNGKFGTPCRTDYCPSKFALDGFFASLRYEVPDVHLCLVSPGYVLSEIHEPLFKAYGGQRNMSKFMTAEDAAREIAEAILNNERDHVMTFMGRAGVLVRPFLPDRVSDWITRKSSNAAFAFENFDKSK